MPKKLRIAIITNPNTYYVWQEAIVSKLLHNDDIEIVLNIKYDQPKVKKTRSSYLWNIYKRIDSNFFNPEPFALKPITKKDKIHQDIEDKCISEIEFFDLRPYALDIILNLSDYTSPNIDISNVSYGMWFITHCNLNTINKKPYGIWELLDKQPESVAVLRYKKDRMLYPETIAVTSSCTDRLSYKRNINSLMWQSYLLIIHNLRLLIEDESLFADKLKTNKSLFEGKSASLKELPPSNFRILTYTLKLYYNKIAQLISSKFYFNQWALIYQLNEDEINPYELNTYKIILPPKDRFWADPFLYKRNGKTYLFIEELIYKNKLGHLSVMEIDQNGNYTQPETIMVKDYHLSYPFIFEDNDELYMIPETSGNKDIQLYKCTAFPQKWELEKVLMTDVVAVDTTLHKKDGKYWIFTNLKKHQGASKHIELYAFSSDNLLSNKWTEHPLNPIVVDVKTSRPAGSIFKKNNKLYRPSQNCSNYYGYGLNIMEITEISSTSYKERLHVKIEPKWHKHINSTHTFNSLDNMFISDVKIKRRRFF